MNIKGKLTFMSEYPDDLISHIVDALSPDNIKCIKTTTGPNSTTILFEGEKVGTILSSVDDYLMNAKIAYELLKLNKHDKGMKDS